MTCIHHEIMSYQDGKFIGTCQKCGQVKQYDPEAYEKPIIIKEGNMEETMEEKLNMTPEELKKAQAEHMMGSDTPISIRIVPEKETGEGSTLKDLSSDKTSAEFSRRMGGHLLNGLARSEPITYKKMNKGETHRFFKRNREKILADAELLGQKAARKKWGIKSSTWVGLMDKWAPWRAPYTDVLTHKAEGKAHLEAAIGYTPAADPLIKKPYEGIMPFYFPKFPEWDAAWSDVVKVAWLEGIAALIKKV